MSEAKTQVSLGDVAIALELVGTLLSQITIPASRAQDFAVTTAVLSELKALVDRQINAAADVTQGEVPSETDTKGPNEASS